MLKNKRF